SSVARRCPGTAIRVRAGKAVGSGRGSFIPDAGADHSLLSSRDRHLKHRPLATPDTLPPRQNTARRRATGESRLLGLLAYRQWLGALLASFVGLPLSRVWQQLVFPCLPLQCREEARSCEAEIPRLRQYTRREPGNSRYQTPML